jgi:hypothetical protein
MDSCRAHNIEKQEARWIELGLDKAVPKPELKSPSQRPNKKGEKRPMQKKEQARE